MRLLILIGALLAMPASAVERLTVDSNAGQTAVVELFTSEGCSSCPPADRWLAALLESPKSEVDVLALAFHVDYWDYLGWKDRFASPDYTRRQRQLSKINRQPTIYTPEFFINGRETRGTRNLLAAIKASNQKTAALQLQLSVTKSASSVHLKLHTKSLFLLDETLHHRYFLYESGLGSEVKRGENSGTRLEHQQVVRYMSEALPLAADNRHSIPINPQWQLDQIGVAAVVTTPQGKTYIQAVHTPIAALLVD